MNLINHTFKEIKERQKYWEPIYPLSFATAKLIQIDVPLLLKALELSSNCNNVYYNSNPGRYPKHDSDYWIEQAAKDFEIGNDKTKL